MPVKAEITEVASCQRHWDASNSKNAGCLNEEQADINFE
jgi:hypothetical protein